MHTYTNTLHILCEAFHIETNGRDAKCEKLLIEAGWKINQEGKMLVPIIDDAHLMDVECLRKLRLLFEDFPKNHNLVLFAQPQLMHKLHLTVNEDIKSRITYSVRVPRLNPDDLKTFLYAQFDLVGLGHNAFSEDAVALIVRSSEGHPAAHPQPLSLRHARSRPRPQTGRRPRPGQPRPPAASLEKRP